MIFAFAPHGEMKYPKRLKRLMKSGCAAERHLCKRRGNIRKPSLLRFGTVAFHKTENRLDRENGVFKKLNSLCVSFFTAANEALSHLIKTCAKSITYCRSKIGGDVEYDPFLAESNALIPSSIHLVIRMKIRNLLHRAQKRNTLTVHKLRMLGLQHLFKTDSGALLIADTFTDKAIKKRFPVDIATKDPLLFVKRSIQQALYSFCHPSFSSQSTDLITND